MSYDSTDSGVYELEDEYSFVVTEFSSPEIIAKVEYEFQSPSQELGKSSQPLSNFCGPESVVSLNDADLTIMGIACKRLLSGKQKIRFEENEVLESLRTEGLLTVNASKKAGSVR